MKSPVLKMAIVAAAVLVSGCAQFRQHKGVVLDQQLVAGIQPGVDNKDSVTKLLGRPTFAGQFNSNDWYYVSRDTRAFAFKNPRVSDQTVLHVRFDRVGNVAAVNQTDETLIAAINPNNDKTPTLGRDRSFFEELFNNIGTISQPGLPGSQRQ